MLGPLKLADSRRMSVVESVTAVASPIRVRARLDGRADPLTGPKGAQSLAIAVSADGSTVAGMTLATYYPFAQTNLYASLHGVPWHLTLTFLMIALTILMVSNVHYPTLPRAGFRTATIISVVRRSARRSSAAWYDAAE